MHKDNWGVWKITVPPTPQGACAIPHDSKLKVRLAYFFTETFIHNVQISMILPSGEHVERLPAWIKRVTQDLAVSPVYEARFWNPPESQRYQFKHKRPSQSGGTKIYEAHVGISTAEGRVGTYAEFTRDVLPRIKKLGYNTIQLMAIVEHAYYACTCH
jgi:1,4-alpha-glucan branching enzyme